MKTSEILNRLKASELTMKIYKNVLNSDIPEHEAPVMTLILTTRKLNGSPIPKSVFEHLSNNMPMNYVYQKSVVHEAFLYDPKFVSLYRNTLRPSTLQKWVDHPMFQNFVEVLESTTHYNKEV